MDRPADAPAPPVEHLQFKAALLLALLVALVAAAGLYLLYARGAFEPTQRLVLVADEAEGVRVGMDLGFAGFPIGRVRGIELGAAGNARILVDVPRRDARWLRTSSVFTLVRNVLGGTSLHAYTGVLGDPPLPDGAERPVLIGDTGAELQRVVTAAREVLQNVGALTAADSALGTSLANLEATTARLAGRHGALGVLLGRDEDAARVAQALERTNALLARVDGVVARVDGVVARADAQVFGADGVTSDVRAAVRQLDTLLGEARGALRRADGVLQELQGVAANARVATTDLGALRAEVDASLRKVQHLVDEIERKWPFARERELKLP